MSDTTGIIIGIIIGIIFGLIAGAPVSVGLLYFLLQHSARREPTRRVIDR